MVTISLQDAAFEVASTKQAASCKKRCSANQGILFLIKHYGATSARWNMVLAVSGLSGPKCCVLSYEEEKGRERV